MKSVFFILADCFVGVFCLILVEVCNKTVSLHVILVLFASQLLTASDREAGTKQSRSVVNTACGPRCRACRVCGEYLLKGFTACWQGGREGGKLKGAGLTKGKSGEIVMSLLALFYYLFKKHRYMS
jgi:hypothetical protein